MGKKMDARQYIRIRGANENNLKNIDVDIPRNELVRSEEHTSELQSRE